MGHTRPDARRELCSSGRTQVWQSPDPILGSYLDGQGSQGGVYKPVNLNLYGYVQNNPINLVDPDGRLTKEEGAYISHHVYGGNTYLPEYISMVNDSNELKSYGLSKNDLVNIETGFQSAIYKNSKTGEVVYAFAGTEFTSVADWKSGNLSQGAFGGLSAQYSQAKSNAVAFTNATQGMDTAFTGHSLGGGLAAASSQRTGVEAKTYNAAGVHGLTNIGATDYGNGAIDNYYVRGEILTYSQNGKFLGWLLPDSVGRQHELVPADPFPKRGFHYENLAHRVELHSMHSVKKSMGLELE